MQHFSTIFVCGTFFLEYPIGLRFCRTHLDNYQISEIKSWELSRVWAIFLHTLIFTSEW